MPRPRFASHPKVGRKKFRQKGREVKKIIRQKWYPFRVTKVKCTTNNPTRLRKGLTPGTVVILLTGPYRGRRVVYLKQMEHSGLLLVTGPFAINGVPLRRVSQKFVIITSTRIDISKVTGLENIKDDYFKHTNRNRARKIKFPAEKKKVQLNVDNQLMELVTKTKLMKEYLTSYFTVVPGHPPHAIKF